MTIDSPENYKVLITGGAGFIGSHLTDELLDKGYKVRVLDNLRNGNLSNLSVASTNQNFEFFQGDILNVEDCYKALDKVDIVYHLACLGVRHSLHSPYENQKVNAEGSINILDASFRVKIIKFFYISTSEVYGNTKEFPINENVTPYPNTIYGSSKLAGEHYTTSYNKCFGLNTTVLRIFNNFGPRSHYEGDSGEIIPRTIVNILNNNEPIIFGDGHITRDFIFVKDTARALCSIIDNPSLNGLTINIGTGIEYSIKYIVETILKRMNKNHLKIKYLENRPADVQRLWVDTSKLNELINYWPQYSFEKGLDETIRYFKSLYENNNLIAQMKEINWE